MECFIANDKFVERIQVKMFVKNILSQLKHQIPEHIVSFKNVRFIWGLILHCVGGKLDEG